MYYFGTHNERVCIKLADRRVSKLGYPRRHPARVHSQYRQLELHLAEPLLCCAAVYPVVTGLTWTQCVQQGSPVRSHFRFKNKNCEYITYLILTLQNWLSESSVFLHTFILFRANDTGQLSSCDVDWTWQCSTLDFNRVDPCLVLVYSANCDFRCLVPTHVAGALMGACASSISCSQISSVLDGPAIRTLCSCWNHGNGWSTLHVAEGTRRWFII